MTKPDRHMVEPSVASLLQKLTTSYPKLRFVAGKTFCWSPHTYTITYRTDVHGPNAAFSLLHEVGHALSEHQRYRLDFELLDIEVAAWEQAVGIAPRFGLTIDEDHVQDCLDSYRDWLYRRSICPSCSAKSLQHDNGRMYSCFNCHAVWSVAPSRFCRPYRQTAKIDIR